jgi:hypothetical protein
MYSKPIPHGIWRTRVLSLREHSDQLVRQRAGAVLPDDRRVKLGVPVASEQNVTLSPLPPCRAAVQGAGGSGRTLEQMAHQPSSVGAEVLEWLVGVIRPLGGMGLSEPDAVSLLILLVHVVEAEVLVLAQEETRIIAVLEAEQLTLRVEGRNRLCRR